MAMNPLAIVAWAAIALTVLACLPAATANTEVAKTSGLEVTGQGAYIRHLLSGDDDDGAKGIYVDDVYIVIHEVVKGYVHHYNDTYDCYTIDDKHYYHDDGKKHYGLGDDDDDTGYGGGEHDDDGYGGDHDDDGYGGDDRRKLLENHKSYILIAKCPDDYTYSKGGVHVVFYKSAKGAVYYKKGYGVGYDDDDGDVFDDDDDGKGYTAGPKHKKVYGKSDDGYDDDGHVTTHASPKKVYAKKSGDDDGYGGGDDKRRRMLSSRAMLSLK